MIIILFWERKMKSCVTHFTLEFQRVKPWKTPIVIVLGNFIHMYDFHDEWKERGDENGT
jgi:hypothetical protein